MYEKHVAGLSSNDPVVVIDSALWIVQNPQTLPDQNCYMQACDVLLLGAKQDADCLKYIDQALATDLPFRAQLYARLVSENPDREILQLTMQLIGGIIQNAVGIKKTSTEVVAEIYSALEQSGNPEIIAKAKQLL